MYSGRMRSAAILVVLMISGGCKQEKQPQAASGSASVATTPTPAPSDAPAETCEPSGTYRFRFRSNGHDGWWFRFEIQGGKATLVEKVEVLGLKPGPLELAVDPAACKLRIRVKSDAVGELSLAIALDAKAGTFKGSFTRTKGSANEQTLEIAGVRDLGPPRPAAACIVPGLYELTYGEATWKNVDAEDDRSCGDADNYALSAFVRVEPFGTSLAITKRESLTPYEEAWATDKLTQLDPCNVTLALSGDNASFEAKLTFTPEGITGIASRAVTEIVEDGDEGRGIWECVAENVPISGKRVP